MPIEVQFLELLTNQAQIPDLKDAVAASVGDEAAAVGREFKLTSSRRPIKEKSRAARSSGDRNCQ
jgi:hypothetical protein